MLQRLLSEMEQFHVCIKYTYLAAIIYSVLTVFYGTNVGCVNRRQERKMFKANLQLVCPQH